MLKSRKPAAELTNRARIKMFRRDDFPSLAGFPVVMSEPEPPTDLERLLAFLDAIPPLEFVYWRQQAAIVADWLEERGDERGTRLREAVDGVQLDFCGVGHYLVCSGRSAREWWRHAAEGDCFRIRTNILTSSGLPVVTRYILGNLF